MNKLSEIQVMNKSLIAPYADYYMYIRWDNGFEAWNLVRFGTPRDQSCLFHAIANGYFAPYHNEIFNNEYKSRNEIVTMMRNELALKLSEPINETQNVYDILNNGNTALFSKAVPEFRMLYMQEQLNSQVPIGYGYMDLIGNCLNKDIYILEALRNDIYVTDELPYTIKGTRPSIILYYVNGHYELVGVQNADGTFTTHFDPEHSLIRFLYLRVQEYVTSIDTTN
jgi:hypothetical protein